MIMTQDKPEIIPRSVTAGQDMKKWHDLAASKLTPEEAEALRTEDAELYEIYRPFDQATEQRIVDSVLALLPRRELPFWRRWLVR